MAKQEQPVQQIQGREVTRATLPRGYWMTRSAGLSDLLDDGPGRSLPPGPVRAPAKNERGDGPRHGRVRLESGGAGTAVWAPRVEVSQKDGNYQASARLRRTRPREPFSS